MRILCSIMGIFDIIIGIIVLIALVNGWRKGLVVQICSLVAVIGGIWLASEYGGDVAGLFGIDAKYAEAAGFLILFLMVLILLSVLSRLVKKLFSFVGLGVLDSIFGALISSAKVVLILGILCSAFDSLNVGGRFVEKKTLNKTIFFRPLCRTVEVFDLFDIDKAGKALEDSIKKTADKIDLGYDA